MGRPTLSEKGTGTPKTVHWLPEQYTAIQKLEADTHTSFSRAANLLVASGSQDAAEKALAREKNIKGLQALNQEKDAIIERLRQDVEALRLNSVATRGTISGIDLSTVHPLHRDLVKKALEAKP